MSLFLPDGLSLVIWSLHHTLLASLFICLCPLSFQTSPQYTTTPMKYCCSKSASTLLIFITNTHMHTHTHSHMHTHFVHYQKWAVSQLKSHKEHNKAPPSANLLAMSYPRGHTSKHKFTGVHSCTHTYCSQTLKKPWHADCVSMWGQVVVMGL